ncbi:MAG TPA: M13 family metallopeptidase [Candidatus Barnesiella merdipullorum]|nr:M13 family metallopeptidase [Candidatus Barnesiella merdipullorum]
MKKVMILSFAAALMATGYAGQSNAQTSGIDLSNLDTTVACGDDFYEYACGGWMKKNPLKPEYARYGSFDQLRENNQEQIRLLFEDLSKQKAEPGSVAQKIGDLYNMGLDSVRLNKEGAAPIAGELKRIQSLSGKKAMSAMIGEMHRTMSAPFFAIYVDADAKNSSMNIAGWYQAGMNMGDRDYYVSDDESSRKIRDSYTNYIKTLFTLAGYSQKAAEQAAATVLKVETAIAKAAFTREELRDPQAGYNVMTVADLKKQYDGLDWDVYFKTVGLDGVQKMNIGQPRTLKAVNDLLKTLSVQEMRDYLAFNCIDGAAPYLSDDFVNARFDFYSKTLSGKEQIEPRWKRALNVPNSLLSEAVGEMYVAKYFPPEAKERMVQLVANLQTALGQHIDSLEWMSAETKAKAHEKLNTFYVKIGYPDKWRDYSGLTIDPKESYYANVRRAAEFETLYSLKDEGKPVDKAKWYMSPQTVNAYYNPSSNEICFPAGILQPPFFNFDADDAVNYGAIGVVIGHEMTHGFDDQGRQYDKDGNLNDWWTPEDAEQFNQRAEILAKQYDNIIVLDTVHANGHFTLGENIADHGGLRIAYTAFRNSLNGVEPALIDGFTADQRFYLSYANLWAGNIRDAEILRLTKIDPHSLGRWRVNAALRNIDTFFKAFNIKEGDPMYLAPQDRVVIW